LIVVGKAASLKNVGRDVAYVLMQHGHIPRMLTYRPSIYDAGHLAEACIIVFPASPLFGSNNMLFYRDLRIHLDMPTCFYTTIEGRPSYKFIREWMLREVEFVANSCYVRDRLIERGFRVEEVVPHGIVRETVENAKNHVSMVERRLKRLHGDKVVFGCLSFWHRRKGLDLLAEAVRVLRSKRNDFVVHLVTNSLTPRTLGRVDGLYYDLKYGERTREEVLAFLGAIDFLIVPSLAEGFCLPLLEANAMGTPAVFCEYPPLTDVGDPRCNFTFEYDDVEWLDIGEGIDYELHVYKPEWLAEAMEQAIDLKLHDKRGYERRSKRCTKVLDKFDALKIYKGFAEIPSG